jgi:hypothetical protein
MMHARRTILVAMYSWAFLGVSLVLLCSACSQEPAGSPSPSPSSPAVQSPPQVGPSSENAPAPADKVLRVVKDKKEQQIARVVERGEKMVLLRDGQAGPEYDQIGEVAFSADGRSLAYEAQKGKSRVLVLDGREWPLEAEVVQGSLVVSPDNKRLALVAMAQDKWQVMVDGRPDPPFDFVMIDTLKFSRNSKHSGYLALKGTKLQVMVDGKTQAQFDILSEGNKSLQEFLSQAEQADLGKNGEEPKK